MYVTIQGVDAYAFISQRVNTSMADAALLFIMNAPSWREFTDAFSPGCSVESAEQILPIAFFKRIFTPNWEARRDASIYSD